MQMQFKHKDEICASNDHKMILGAAEQTLTGMNIFINDATGIFLSTRKVRNVLNKHAEKKCRGTFLYSGTARLAVVGVLSCVNRINFMSTNKIYFGARIT